MSEKALDIALSNQQNEDIFKELILPSYISNDEKGNTVPKVILLGGQPGAGKSKLLNESEQELKYTGTTVVINGDDLLQYHPDYEKLQSDDPLNAARLTDHDSGKWVEKFINAAAEKKVHLIIEGTFRNPKVPENTANMLHSYGYTVEAKVMAVEPELSWLGCNQRYEAMIKYGAPRFTTKEAHDAALTGIPKTLDNLQNNKLVDRISIYNREGETLYNNILTNGRWEHKEQATTFLNKIYSNGLNPEKEKYALREWQNIIESRQSRQAPDKEIVICNDAIKNITSKFLIPSEEVRQLSPNDINRMVSDKKEVRDQKEVIENLSLLVYGRKNALDNELENLNQNKNHTNVIANQIKTDPEQIAPLAGEKKMIIGKDQTRKTAELNAPRLSQAIDDYRDIRQRAETTLIREHNSERDRKSLSVAYPSNEVMQVLSMPVEKQKEALQKSPELQNQIQSLSTKINERLSPSENKAILKGDNESLAKSLNVSSAQAKTIANTVQQTRTAERQIQAVRTQTKQQGIDKKPKI